MVRDPTLYKQTDLATSYRSTGLYAHVLCVCYCSETRTAIKSPILLTNRINYVNNMHMQREVTTDSRVMIIMLEVLLGVLGDDKLTGGCVFRFFT